MSEMLERGARAALHGPVDPTGMGDSATSLATILSDGDRIVGAPCEDVARHCAYNVLEAALSLTGVEILALKEAAGVSLADASGVVAALHAHAFQQQACPPLSVARAKARNEHG